jgi:hypothetical protein
VFGHVRPGAETPCGYPSSGFAPFAGVEIARVKAEIKEMHRSDFGLKLITKPYYQKVIWDSSLQISNN